MVSDSGEIESDCLSLVLMLQEKRKEASVTKIIVNDVVVLASSFDFCVSNFASSSCNKVAQFIANASLCLVEDLVWMKEWPPDDLPLVIQDKTSLI